jgi:uncharacterized protein (DUF924 family)
VTPDDVLDFWFGEPAEDFPGLMRQMRRLNASLDQEVRDRFGAHVEEAFTGAFASWSEAPRSALALTLLLDQFPRHVFRGSARQYDGDERALALALRAVELGWENDFVFVERVFLLMPLAHAENLDVQRRNVIEADRTAAAAPPWVDFMAEVGPSQARKYFDVIERFGRFPHRNEMLGRTSTPEELAFLVDWPARQAPDALRERGLLG